MDFQFFATYGQTDRRTDRQTDKPSHRSSLPELKNRAQQRNFEGNVNIYKQLSYFKTQIYVTSICFEIVLPKQLIKPNLFLKALITIDHNLVLEG